MTRIIPVFLAMLLVLSACSKTASDAHPDVDHWTCSMHPSVNSKDPGNCPICGMDLVPVLKKGAVAASVPSSESSEFAVPVERQQQIGVSYATVERRALRRTVRAVGLVEADRKRSWSFVARTDGYVQELFVASPGQQVERGAPLLSLYSPDLLTAEREFVMLSRQSGKSSDLLASAKARLRQWNVSDAQIESLSRSENPREIFTLESPFRGVVERVMARQGASVKTGDALVDVADLSAVWVWADVYETELAFLKPGQTVAIAATAFPGREFAGVVAVIDPAVDAVKRTARARLDVPNPDLALRPGMFVDATFSLDAGNGLAVPVDAIMPTGSRNVVFVDKGEGKLEPRMVKLGPKFGAYYEVTGGLVAGERIVDSANFLIDAESKLQGALRDFDPEEGASPEVAAMAAPPALSSFVQAYLDLHGLLAIDKLDGVAVIAATLRKNSEALPDQAALGRSVADFHPTDLESARVGFGKISAALLPVLQKYPASRRLYVMRCPMWNSSPSEWVQVSRKTENPFMGQAMATCGATIRTLGR